MKKSTTTTTTKAKTAMSTKNFANNMSATRKAIKNAESNDLNLSLLTTKKVFSHKLNETIEFANQEKLTRCKSMVNKVLKNETILNAFNSQVRKTKKGLYCAYFVSWRLN